MALKDMLFADLKQAMKDKDTVKKDIVQMVRAGVLQIEKDNKIEASDEDVMVVINKEIKKLNDVLPDFKKADRQDLIDEAEKKIAILKAYLPEQMSEDAIKELIRKTVEATGAVSMKDMGKVMGAVSAQTKGRADNRLVSQLVKEVLSAL
ncbi:MAG: GatB/YqeY domain-containing protein [Firmicutes bacterium]|nr:GatB/YqeY domain-containing protein [Bacillota bacterium]